ncbi:A24 family peptidase C-terminal domain-containing protein [Pyrodictium abyssi]|uniref:Preflagellin peptidase C-terminal domain-containing protein n=1 Tax=Pyrodictium abyssi TaxID=54256 RepID=A0ABM8IX60_9CREN|nr:hypothetical protein PABY_16980 [Pyrodictium abyssi]
MYTEIAAILALLAFSLYDIKTRELPEKHVYAALAIMLILRVAEYRLYGLDVLFPLWVYIVLDGVILAATATVAILGFFGWGDVAVLLLITMASPVAEGNCIIMPPALMVLVYYVLANVAIMVANLVVNVTRNMHELRRLPLRYRLIYALIARPVNVQRLLDKPGWWYPLSLCGNYTVKFNIYLDPDDIVEEVRKAIRKGCTSQSDTVWVTYGIPGVPLFTASYMLTLLVGDKPLLSMLGIRLDSILAG